MAASTSNGAYPYQGLPLTPAIFKSLATESFRGKVVERQVLIDEVVRVHLLRGGVKQKGNIRHSANKALSNLLGSGAAENPSPGHWRFPSDEPALVNYEQESTEEEASQTTPLGAADSEALRLPEPDADVVLGNGPSAIYVYYLPTFRLRAEDHAETMWPCKIGRSDRDPLARVLAQAGTALPELPRIALIVRTSFAVAWEAALHGVLTLRGRRITDSPGSEWFLTSPTEVLELVRFFDPELAKSEG